MTINVELTKLFGAFHLDAQFTAPSRGIIGLLGQSGSGKTSLMRCIAGLEQAEGIVSIGDEVWQDRRLFTPAYRRPVGFVFQESSLFEHLTVRGNLEFGRKRIPQGDRNIGFDNVVEMLGLRPFLHRHPARLSGGERQRVAIGRALLASPRLLLMDEPMSALDHDSKEELFPFLAQIHAELHVPVLYVSHLPDEVARLADYLVLLQKGRVIAADDIHAVMTELDLPLALSTNAEAIIEAKVSGHDDKYHLTYLEFSGGTITAARIDAKVGRPVRVRISARDVSLVIDKPVYSTISNIFPVEVKEVSMSVGLAHVVIRLNARGSILLARVTRKSAESLGVAAGKSFYAQVKTVALLL